MILALATTGLLGAAPLSSPDELNAHVTECINKHLASSAQEFLDNLAGKEVVNTDAITGIQKITAMMGSIKSTEKIATLKAGERLLRSGFLLECENGVVFVEIKASFGDGEWKVLSWNLQLDGKKADLFDKIPAEYWAHHTR
jgi:hypothetical protein